MIIYPRSFKERLQKGKLKLLGLVKFVAATAKTDERDIAISFFEKGVIKKIKSYGK